MPLVQKVVAWVSILSASICACEKSFSAQKDTEGQGLSLTRNRLQSEKVQKLVNTSWNMRLINGISPGKQDAIEYLVATGAFLSDTSVDEGDVQTCEDMVVIRDDESISGSGGNSSSSDLSCNDQPALDSVFYRSRG